MASLRSCKKSYVIRLFCFSHEFESSTVKDESNPSNTTALKDNLTNTIFVGNLPNTMKTNELKKLFCKFGKIFNTRLRCAVRKELKIPKKLAVIKKTFHQDNTHISAFIRFESFSSCKSALKMNGRLVEGHHIRVTLAEDKGYKDPRKSIFLGNIPFNAEDDDLWKVFEDCGVIDNVRIVRDHKTGIGKGFGFVNFKSADSVQLALKLDGETLLDREIRVRTIGNNKGHKKRIKHNIKPMKQEAKKKISEKNTKEHEFQGQKSKSTKVKKKQKKTKFNKKKYAISQIAERMRKSE